MAAAQLPPSAAAFEAPIAQASWKIRTQLVRAFHR
jgi:hypothetical protein